MVKKVILVTLVFLLLILLKTPQAFADFYTSDQSAKLQNANPNKGDDSRVKILKAFLAKQDSPLTSFAPKFVEYADVFNLDWKLVAAISGLESTFGKEIPYNSYNGWGWGIYGNNVIYFSSWDEGIKTVSEGLRENYIDKWGAKDIYEIGRLYAASPTWAVRVSFIMEKIQEFALANSKDSLSLSL